MLDKIVIQSGGAESEADALRQRILLAENQLCSSGTVYYVSQNGDDANDGLSPENPIKSYSHIADLPLEKGDRVLFERGSLFRISEMLWLKSGVCYGAYGQGEKPRIYGSLRNYADPAVWKRTQEPHIWCTELATALRAGATTFNHDTYVGVWKYTKPELCRDGDFYHDQENGIYYLYYEGGNPGECFDSIEISTTDVAMRGAFTEDVHVDNLCFKYDTFGPFLMGEVKRISITNCEMGWHGGKIFGMREQGPLRYGNAIEFWHQCEDITVKNCWVYQVFDAAMTFQGYGEDQTRFVNIQFADNLIEYCSMNIEYWAGQKEDKVPPHIENIIYKGNIIRFGGYGWGGIYRWDKEDQAMLLGWNNQYHDLHNFVITDNILDCADCYMIYMKTPKEQKGLSVNRNTYYQKSVSGTHDFVEIIKGTDTWVKNQKEFETAVSYFDETPKLVKWLD